MIYKIFIRLSLSGVIIRYLRVSSKRDFYTYLGYLYCNSIEHIERVDYKVVVSVPNSSEVIDFDCWAYAHL